LVRGEGGIVLDLVGQANYYIYYSFLYNRVYARKERNLSGKYKNLKLINSGYLKVAGVGDVYEIL